MVISKKDAQVVRPETHFIQASLYQNTDITAAGGCRACLTQSWRRKGLVEADIVFIAAAIDIEYLTTLRTHQSHKYGNGGAIRRETAPAWIT